MFRQVHETVADEIAAVDAGRRLLDQEIGPQPSTSYAASPPGV